jgi:hypothetical protein
MTFWGLMKDVRKLEESDMSATRRCVRGTKARWGQRSGRVDSTACEAVTVAFLCHDWLADENLRRPGASAWRPGKFSHDAVEAWLDRMLLERHAARLPGELV